MIILMILDRIFCWFVQSNNLAPRLTWMHHSLHLQFVTLKDKGSTINHLGGGVVQNEKKNRSEGRREENSVRGAPK